MAVSVLISFWFRTDAVHSCDLKLRKVYTVSMFELSTLIANVGEVAVVEELSVVLCCEEVGCITTDFWGIEDVRSFSDWLLMSEGKTPNFVVDAKSLVELEAKIPVLDMVLFGVRLPVFDIVLLGVKLPVIDMVFGDG